MGLVVSFKLKSLTTLAEPQENVINIRTLVVVLQKVIGVGHQSWNIIYL